MTIPAIDQALKTKASKAPLWEIAFLLCNEPFALAGGCLVTDHPNDYDDFKKQLEAVDLRVLTEDESDSAWHLYTICCERGLVRNV